MKKILLLLALFFLLLPNAYSQKKQSNHTKIGIDLQADFRAVNLPLIVKGPEGDRFNVRTGSTMSVVFQKDDYPGYLGSFLSPNIGVLIMNPQSPLSLRVGCGLESLAFCMEYPHVIRQRWCFFNGVKPKVDVKYVLTRYAKENMLSFATLSAAYCIPVVSEEAAYFHENPENSGFAKNGLEGEMAIGLMHLPEKNSRWYAEFSLVYRYCFYNLFDPQFQNEAGEKPFEGLTTHYGDIRLRFVVGGFLN